MARFLIASLCVLALVLAQTQPEEQQTPSPYPGEEETVDPTLEDSDDALKNDTADGRRHRHRHHHHDRDYDYGYGGYRPNYYTPPVHDRNVCDMDASVLLVTDHHRHSHNKAHRVRCSEISGHDVDSCNVCCRHAARRDRSIRNEDIFGILTVSDGYHRHEHHDRHKRGSGYSDDSDEYEGHALGDDEIKDFPNGADPTFYKNVKCLCCAPKRQFNPVPPPVPVYQPPVYVQPRPVYQSQPIYTAQAPIQPQYSAPVATQPIYNSPVAQAPSAYSAPAQSQNYQQQPAQSPIQNY